MDGNGDGGTQAATSRFNLRCVTCGVSGFPPCAVVLDSTTCCPRCAQSVQDFERLDLNLSVPVKWFLIDSDTFPSTTAPAEAKWVVLVARDQPDLLEHLASAFAADDKVQIVIDRRKDYSRNPPGLEDRLRIHGAAVVRRRPSTGLPGQDAPDVTSPFVLDPSRPRD